MTVLFRVGRFLGIEMEAITSGRPAGPVLLEGWGKADLVGTQFAAFKDVQHCDDDHRARDKKAFVGVQQPVSVLSSEVWLEKRSPIFSVRITAEASYLEPLNLMSRLSHTLIWDQGGIAAVSRFYRPENVHSCVDECEVNQAARLQRRLV